MTPKRERFLLYGVVTVLGALLMIVGLVAWRDAKVNREAEEKAGRLIAAVQEVGGQPPSQEQVVRLLGTDGGPVCANPTEALNRAARLAELSNGAGGPGQRPVLASSTVVKGELLIIGIYCPEQLSEFQRFVDGLRTGDVDGE